jgi:UDP-hydrolysing UDP-N-acetyl-D-glucosamine 2-epimerase
MRTIGVVSVGRSDYGIYLPILRAIQADADLSLQLIAGGMHLSPRHGMTVRLMEADGFEIADRVEMWSDSDSPQDIARQMGQGLIGFSQVYARRKPDILVVLGDRFEMFSAALAALPFNLPVAHIHGGELTQGAMDDSLRHSMTKLSHLHFVSTQEYAKRVIQLGEESWRVIISGAPGLDNIDTLLFLNKKELEARLNIDLGQPTLLVTFHPVTLEHEQVDTQIIEVLTAIEKSGFQALFTMPNADTGNHQIVNRISAFVSSHSNTKIVDNLGTQMYFSLMKYSAAMIGNSSSGIIEAPSFALPVVNIGLRQAGRVRGKNVIDVECNAVDILSGILRAVSPEFRSSLLGVPNPYKQGSASGKIVGYLKNVVIDKKLLMKSFHDL